MANQKLEKKILCRMEENTRLYDVLDTLGDGYRRGVFSGFFKYLADDCVLESQWVTDPVVGYDEVVRYFNEKGQSLSETGVFPVCDIVELLGNYNPVRNAEIVVNGTSEKVASVGLLYTPGKLCMLMEQEVGQESVKVLVDVTIDGWGTVKRIDLCMPELFGYRDFYTFVDFLPATSEKENEDARIRISEPYYGELYLFFTCANDHFDEYDDLHIPMQRWCEILDYWKMFLDAKNYDQAFEMIAGVDYEAGTIAKPEVAIMLGRIGKGLWDGRQESRVMLEGLLEWTDLYKDTFDFVNSVGW